MLMELHGFCDSSEVAYAGVVYAKMFISSGTVQVKLISGKSKVAPLKKLSIPRWNCFLVCYWHDLWFPLSMLLTLI